MKSRLLILHTIYESALLERYLDLQRHAVYGHTPENRVQGRTRDHLEETHSDQEIRREAEAEAGGIRPTRRVCSSPCFPAGLA